MRLRPSLTSAASTALIATAIAGVASATPNGSRLPLTARVLHAGEFLGLAPQRPLTIVRSAQRWASIAVPPGTAFNAALLTKDGFVGGISEQLHWQARNIDGLSDVVQLGSPAAARAYLSIYSRYRPRFPVTAIRGAQGFAPNGGINVVFASGDYAYLVGAGWQAGSGQPPTKAQLIAAAKLLYSRVQGR